MSWVVARAANRADDLRQVADRNVAWCISAAAILTVIIVTQVNLKLYFPTTVLERAAIEKTYWLGIVLGILRLLAEACALFYSVKSARMPVQQPIS